MWWCDEKRSDEHALLDAAIREVEMCLGHGGSCCVYIGLLNPGAQSISYVAASQHSRMKGCSLLADQAFSYKCISESKTVLIQDLAEARRLGVHVFGNPLYIFPSVCTPLRARLGHPIGVLSIDGLCPNTTHVAVAGITQGTSGNSEKNATRTDYCDRIAPFLAKDDEGCKRIRFWKLNDQFKNEGTGIYYGVAARVICGRIYCIERPRCGCVYFILWEDGLCEKNLSFRAVKELLRLTPESLGIGVPCDASLLGFVDYSGKIIGEHLIRSVLAL